MWGIKTSLFLLLLASFCGCQARPQSDDYGSYDGEEYFYQQYDEDYDMYYNYNYDDGLEDETDEDPYIRTTTPRTTTTTTTTTTRRPYYTSAQRCA